MRRLRSRLGWVHSANIIDHGADPTGRWDSSGAIKRAFNAGQPEFPPGQFKVSGTIDL